MQWILLGVSFFAAMPASAMSRHVIAEATITDYRMHHADLSEIDEAALRAEAQPRVAEAAAFLCGTAAQQVTEVQMTSYNVIPEFLVSRLSASITSYRVEATFSATFVCEGSAVPVVSATAHAERVYETEAAQAADMPALKADLQKQALAQAEVTCGAAVALLGPWTTQSKTFVRIKPGHSPIECVPGPCPWVYGVRMSVQATTRCLK